jgi:excisionase family DNA binding protein
VGKSGRPPTLSGDLIVSKSTPPRRDASAPPTAKLLTIRQTAEILTVCEKTVRRLITAKVLRALRVGRSLRVSEDDLTLYLARCREGETHVL